MRWMLGRHSLVDAQGFSARRLPAFFPICRVESATDSPTGRMLRLLRTFGVFREEVSHLRCCRRGVDRDDSWFRGRHGA